MLTKDTHGRYITILADGKFHETVPAGTDGAILREYETSKGEKGSKWELVYTKLEATITNLGFRTGDYGDEILITFQEGDDELTLSQGAASNFGEDLLKKLPNVDFSEKLSVSPYSFTDEKNGKQVRGVTLYQKGEKLYNFFYKPSDVEGEKGTALHGYPEFEGDKDSKDDWKIHFLKSRKFLIGYVKENILPKFEGVSTKETSSDGFEYPDDDNDPKNIPF